MIARDRRRLDLSIVYHQFWRKLISGTPEKPMETVKDLINYARGLKSTSSSKISIKRITPIDKRSYKEILLKKERKFIEETFIKEIQNQGYKF